jgi:superfamily II DNA or RNA helicase
MIIPYDFQKEALRLVIAAFLEKMTALVVMATGLGKTIVAALWAATEIKKGKRGLLLCHDTGILDQTIGEFRAVFGEAPILKTFYGQRDKDWDADKADIVFASFQTMREWKHVFFEDEFDFIIVDESHHSHAETYLPVIEYFKYEKLLGITATPDREDRKDIRTIFGEEVVDYSLELAIANGWLAKVEYHILNDRINRGKLKKILRDFLTEGKRISKKQLNETIFIDKRDEEISEIIQKFGGDRKQVIIFCENIKHAENFVRFLPNAKTYHSKKNVLENRKTLSEFREGSLQHIISVNKFNEGIDIPHAELIVFLRCTDSRNVFFQQLGRGLRKVPGKEKVIILDFVANCERLITIKGLAEKINLLNGSELELNMEHMQVSGEGFDFLFNDDQLEILGVIERIKKRVIAQFPNLLAKYSEENTLSPDIAPMSLNRTYTWECPSCFSTWKSSVSAIMNKPEWYCPHCSRNTLWDHSPIAKFSEKNQISDDNVIWPRDGLSKYLWVCKNCRTEYEDALWKQLMKWRASNEEIRCPSCYAKSKSFKGRFWKERLDEIMLEEKEITQEEFNARKKRRENHKWKGQQKYETEWVIAKAARLLGIRGKEEYKEKFRLDPELPNPKNLKKTLWEKLENEWKYG